jgi:membrane protein involved in colicin uptake
MKALLKDLAISLALALIVVALLMMSSFDSTFIYRGF